MKEAVAEVLKNLDVVPGSSVSKAVQTVGEEMGNATDPLGYANAIIIKLGGSEQFDVATARIMAKTLVEQAMTMEEFDPVKANEVAVQKVEKLRTDMPFLFVKPETQETESKVVDVEAVKRPRAKGAKKGAKRAVAVKILDQNKDKSLDEVIKLVMEALNVTKSNAYTYIYLIKKSRGEQLGKKKNRKAKAVVAKPGQPGAKVTKKSRKGKK